MVLCNEVKRLVQVLQESSTLYRDLSVALTSRVYWPAMTSFEFEHKVIKTVLGCLKTTSSRVLFIGVSRDTSMSRRLWNA